MTSDSPAPAGASGTESGFMRHTLPVGTLIGGLEITGLIGEGGFGIVYLAFDTTLQRQVALKEYMPSSLASRASTGHDVSVKSPRYADTFTAGLRSFVNEARLLAHFDHPSLVKVHQFWQANRTAYMVMPYYQGPTLKAHLRELAERGRAPDEATLRGWLVPLLDALELMHAEQCYHRDVAPDNILLTANGPLLLDFGAARRVISDMTHALTVMLKPGYAPIEQYGDAASMAQGPWTDLYALGSVVYFAITGHSPITSVERVMGDPLPALSHVAAGRYSANFLRAIDAALSVRPKDRPQSVAELRALLDGAVPVAGAVAPGRPAYAPASPPAPSTPAPAPVAAPDAPPPSASRDGNVIGAPTGLQPMPAVARASRTGWIAALAVGIVLVGFVAAFMARRAGEPAPPPAGSATMQETPAPAAARPAVAPSPAPVNTPVATDPPPAATAEPSRATTPAVQPVPAAAVAASASRAAPARPARASAPAAPPRPATAVPRGVEATRPAAAPAPVDARPAAASVPVPAAAPAPAPRTAAPAPAPGGKPPRCAEILQRGNQQTLSNDDIDFLRKNCR